jgi:non-homologous end joining protein Ku
MLDLAKHIVNQKAGRFEPDKFEDQYETALVDLIKPKARRQANHAKGAAARRERRRSNLSRFTVFQPFGLQPVRMSDCIGVENSPE